MPTVTKQLLGILGLVIVVPVRLLGALVGFIPVYWLIVSHAIAQWHWGPFLLAIGVTLFGNAPLSVLGLYLSAIGTARDITKSPLLQFGSLRELPLAVIAAELPSELLADLRAARDETTSRLDLDLSHIRKQPAQLFVHRGIQRQRDMRHLERPSSVQAVPASSYCEIPSAAQCARGNDSSCYMNWHTSAPMACGSTYFDGA